MRNLRVSRRFVASLLLVTTLAGSAVANDVVTSFEFPDSSGQFTLGSAPRNVTFSGGTSVTLGLFSLYHTGLFAWMIAPGQGGEITFGGPAESVSFFIRDEFLGAPSTVDVFGTSGSLLTSVSVSTTWQQIVAGSAATPVGRITVTNNGALGSTSIDDLTACLRDPWSNYCISTTNSSGGAGLISASGTSSVSANNMRLSATPVPNKPGLLFYGPNQIQLPFGDGFRCVGGNICRLSVSIGAGNTLSHNLDLLAPPNANCLIAPGDTLNFQAWFRDTAAMNTGFNLSDGLQVTFVP